MTRSGLLDGIAAGSRCFPVSFEALARLLLRQATRPRSRRLLIGLTGPHGAGKTTFAQALCKVVDRVASERFGVEEQTAVAQILHVDGFRRPATINSSITDPPIGTSRDGTAGTFFELDACRLVVSRVFEDADETILTPYYDQWTREIRPNAVPITACTRVVIVDGNRILDPEWHGLWRCIRSFWYLAVPHPKAVARARQRYLRSLTERLGIAEGTATTRADARQELYQALAASAAQSLARADYVFQESISSPSQFDVEVNPEAEAFRAGIVSATPSSGRGRRT